MSIKDETLIQAIKYLFVGGTCTLLDFILLFVFVEELNITLLISSSISFFFGVVLNYFLCTHWIFKTRLIDSKPIEFSLYVIISLIGLGLNNLVIWLLSTYFDFYFMLAKGGAACITFFWNFLARKQFVHN